MEMLRKIAINPNVPTYDYGEYLESLHKEIAMEAREQGFSIEETSKLLKIDQNIIKRALKKDN